MKRSFVVMFLSTIVLSSYAFADCQDLVWEWCDFGCHLSVGSYCNVLLKDWKEEKCEGSIDDAKCESEVKPEALSDREIHLLSNFKIESEQNIIKTSPRRQEIIHSLEGIEKAQVIFNSKLQEGARLQSFFEAVSDPLLQIANADLGAHANWQILAASGNPPVLTAYLQLANACIEDRSTRVHLKNANFSDIKTLFISDIVGAGLSSDDSAKLKNLCAMNEKVKDERAARMAYLYWKLSRQFKQDTDVTVYNMSAVKDSLCEKGKKIRMLLDLNILLTRNKDHIKLDKKK